MRRPEPLDLASLSPSQVEWVNAVCNDFEEEWGRDARPAIHDYLERAHDDTETAARLVLLRELLTLEIELREEDAKAHDLEAYRALFTDPIETEVLDFVLGGAAKEEGARRFRIVRPHARGGLGEIFVARDEQLDRVVALKRIRPELVEHESSRARFIGEAEITGRLEHPSIVPVYALGRDRDKRPFYATRFIDGKPFDQVIETYHRDHAAGSDPGKRQLALRKLLGNFIAVCNAVAFAHNRGVLHRDIKPHNVMLGPFGETMLVDWGLAKDLGTPASDAGPGPAQEDEQDGHGVSEAGSVLGTLAYMSPEQAEPKTELIGPASDVYSLGATLYHLLTGRPPFAGKDPEELRRKVIHGEFLPPRGVDRTVPPALDAIVRMAMALHPRDRYPSATALAEDIEHWLADEPVTAGHEPFPVRARRRMRRHRTLVVSTAAGLLVGVLGLAIFAAVLTDKNRELQGQRRQVAAQRDRAESEAETATAINEFLTKDVLAQASANNQATPDRKPDPDLKVRTALDRAAARIEGKFTGKPLVEASIRQTIGETYNQLGLYPQAQPQLERAVELYRGALHEEDPVTLEAMNHLGLLYLAQGKLDLAETLLLKVQDRYHRVRGPEHPDTLGAANSLGQVYFAQGRPKEAERLFVQSLEGVRKALGNDRPETLEAVNNLGLLYQTQGRLAEAEPLLLEAVEGMRRVHGPEHPDALITMQNLGELYFRRDKLADAERLFDQVLKVRIRVLGPDHQDTLNTKNDLVSVYEKQRRWVEAQQMAIDVLEGRRRSLGPEHYDTFQAMGTLATLYHEQDKPMEAERLLKEALAGSRRVYGERNSGTLWIMQNLGSLYIGLGKLTEAEPLLSKAADGLRETLGPEHPDALGAMNQLAMVYGATGKPEKAEPLLKKVLEDARSRLGPEHTQTLGCMQNMAACYHRLGKLAEAEELLVPLLASRRRVPGPEDRETLTAMLMLAQCYISDGKHDLAEPLLVEAMKGRRVLGAERPETLDVMDTLGVVRVNRKTFAEAEPVLRECLEIRKKTMPDGWQRYNTESLLGACLMGQKEFKEAEPLLLSAYGGLKARAKTLPPIFRVRLSDAAERIIQLYEAWGKKDKADEWRKKRPSPSAAVPPKP